MGSTLTEDIRCMSEAKRRIALAKQALRDKSNLLTKNPTDLEVRKE